MTRMRSFVVILLVIVCAVVPAAAQSLGGGVSVWVPESLYLGRGGTVGTESSLGSSVGVGELFSVPFGVSYSKVYGLLATGDAGGGESAPWFVADTLTGFVMGSVRVPLGPLFVDAFGGFAGAWNITLVPLAANIADAISATGETIAFVDTPTVEGGALGYGWQAGGGIGAFVGPVSVNLNVTYRFIRADATVSGDAYWVDAAGPSVSGPSAIGPQAIEIRLAGFSVGLDVSFQM